MQIKVKTVDLLNGLKRISNVASGNKVQYILNNVLIETMPENQIKLTGNNTNIAIETYISGETITEGKFTLNCQKLMQVVNTFDKEITINVVDSQATISEGKSKLTLQGITASEYPKVSELIISDFVELESSLIIEGLDKTSSCVQESSNQALGGISLILDKTKIELCGCDCNMMSIFTHELTTDKEISIIIPVATAKEVMRIGQPYSSVKLYIQNNLIKLDFGSTVIYSTLIEGKYPAYRGLIPQTYKSNVVIDKDYLMGIIKKVETIADKALPGVKFEFTGSKLDITYKSKEGELNEVTLCQFEGDNLFTHLNYGNLLTGLKNLKNGTLNINMNSGLSAITIAEDNYLFLMMPMQVK